MFSVKFSTANEAFGSNREDAAIEIARILRDIAKDVERNGVGSKMLVKDINGNTIGSWGSNIGG
jgi:hypothetical protein